MNSSLMFFTFVSTSSYYVCLSLSIKIMTKRKNWSQQNIYTSNPMHVLLIGEIEIWWGLIIFLKEIKLLPLFFQISNWI